MYNIYSFEVKPNNQRIVRRLPGEKNKKTTRKKTNMPIQSIFNMSQEKALGECFNLLYDYLDYFGNYENLSVLIEGYIEHLKSVYQSMSPLNLLQYKRTMQVVLDNAVKKENAMKYSSPFEDEFLDEMGILYLPNISSPSSLKDKKVKSKIIPGRSNNY